MAIVRAVKTGNWSDTTVWNTGALPTSSDDVYSNTFTVTIDTSPTVLSINNGSATGVTAGGLFVPTNGITLTCPGNGLVGGTSSSRLFVSSLGIGNACTIVANVVCSDGPTYNGVVSNDSTGTVNITGNLSQGATGAARYTVANNSTGTINITGSVTGASSGNAANITVVNSSSGTINITGSCASGAVGGAVSNVTVGAVNIVGQLQATNGVPAFQSSQASATNILTGPFIVSPNGTHAVYAARWFWQNTSPPATYYQIRSANLATIRPLYTADSVGGNPAASNVRSGTVYGPNSELTGTCAVPGAASVVVGTPVDATVGTAAITAATIRTAMGLNSANLDTQLSAIPTAAAIRTEMDANSTRLANLDATVGSRPTAADIATAVWAAAARTLTTTIPTAADIATAVWAAAARTLTTTIPTAADIATAVWAAGTRTLTTAIDNSATIAAAVWAYATGRTITGGTVDTLTNAPSVPSAAEIATEVRTAIRSELAPELARVSNCSTVESTGDQIAALNN